MPWGVVVSIARGYMGYGLNQADLIQEGNIGLMKAVKRFDPERGVPFPAYFPDRAAVEYVVWYQPRETAEQVRSEVTH